MNAYVSDSDFVLSGVRLFVCLSINCFTRVTSSSSSTELFHFFGVRLSLLMADNLKSSKKNWHLYKKNLKKHLTRKPKLM